MNIDQKHFPMLREYEKAKLQMLNTDLNETGGPAGAFNSFDPTQTSSTRSPFQNFVRSTAGKKLYYNDQKTGPLPGTKVND